MTMNKVPQLLLAFWVMKICATTLGETAGDLLSLTLQIGYGLSSVLLLILLIITLLFQLKSSSYKPVIYWSVIISTSTAGTTISDFLDRSVGLGYAQGSLLLSLLLAAVLLLWRFAEGSVSVSDISSGTSEYFYWTAILISNTLGTALGDFLADDSGLGFGGGALLIGTALVVITMLYYKSSLSHVLLFWLAFILTRPFGATFGDLLTKSTGEGGLGFGTYGSSVILFSMLIVLVYRELRIGRINN